MVVVISSIFVADVGTAEPAGWVPCVEGERSMFFSSPRVAGVGTWGAAVGVAVGAEGASEVVVVVVGGGCAGAVRGVEEVGAGTVGVAPG